MVENDLCLGDRAMVGETLRDNELLHAYSFENMFIIDTVSRRQAWYSSIASDAPSGRYPHGPPVPNGDKFSLSLTWEAHGTFPEVYQETIMTHSVWMFLTDGRPSNAWQMVMSMTDAATAQTALEIKLWPDLNRFRINVHTDEGMVSIDTISSLLPRKWYHVTLVFINDQSRVDIYLDGIKDPSSGLLQGDIRTAHGLYNMTVGRTPDLVGSNMYFGYYEIRNVAPNLPQKDQFIVHGCSSCNHAEAELKCNAMDSFYYICSLEDLHTNLGFNVAKNMGWFSSTDSDNDSGTIWLRDMEYRPEELLYQKVAL